MICRLRRISLWRLDSTLCLCYLRRHFKRLLICLIFDYLAFLIRLRPLRRIISALNWILFSRLLLSCPKRLLFVAVIHSSFLLPSDHLLLGHLHNFKLFRFLSQLSSVSVHITFEVSKRRFDIIIDCKLSHAKCGVCPRAVRVLKFFVAVSLIERQKVDLLGPSRLFVNHDG